MKLLNKDLLAEQLERVFDLPNLSDLLDEMLSDPLYKEIIDSFWFNRLFGIPFLGGLSYIEKNDETQTRGHHSLGVGLLALYYSRINNFKKKRERITVLSGLLHDIHHLPFSHTLELAFRLEESYLPHDFDKIIVMEHRANEEKESLEEICERHGIKLINEFLFLRANRYRPLLFRSTHNLDTLEGILRVNQSYYSSSNRDLPKKIIDEMTICNHNRSGKCQSDLKAFDKFWTIKNNIYSQVIYDDKKVFFERVLSYYLYDLCKKKNLVKTVYRLSDKDFFEIFPTLRGTIDALWSYINTSNDNWRMLLALNTKMEPQVKNRTSQAPIKLEFTTRQFKIKRTVGNIETSKLPSLRKRYSCQTKINVLMLDPKAIKNIENIVEYPVSKSLIKYGRIRDNILI